MSCMFALAGCSRGADPSARPQATPIGRFVLGPPQSYTTSAWTAEDEAQAAGSFLSRRAKAWAVVAKVLASASPQQPPAFATWYGRDDIARLFRYLYDGLSTPSRDLRQPFATSAIGSAEAWNAALVQDQWSASRLSVYMQGLSTEERRNGETGLNRTLYSPPTVRHLLGDYARAAQCNGLQTSASPVDQDHHASCFAAEFPADAVAVKTAWRRAGTSLPFTTFATDAASLAAALDQRQADWGPGKIAPEPAPHQAYAMTLATGARFQLAGLHIAAKERRDWLWITLWWSDDPDTDFGEDRPDSIRALGGPWSHYKMCVVTGYTEEAPADDPELTRYPSLAAAFAASRQQGNGASWCSNPYIETGSNNQRTNCIGCHQHAGTPVDTPAILANAAAYPNAGRTRVRTDFPADYLWSMHRPPEDLAGIIKLQLQDHDVYDHLGSAPVHGAASQP